MKSLCCCVCCPNLERCDWSMRIWLYCLALIGQNKGTLRTPADLSRVSHLQVYKCTEAGLNSCITVSSKVCAPQVVTLGPIKTGAPFLQKGYSNYRSGNTGQEVISYIPLMPLVVLAPGCKIHVQLYNCSKQSVCTTRV